MNSSNNLISSLKKILISIFLFGIGIYTGAFFEERETIKGALNESILQLANNVQLIKYIRDGKNSNAIDLVNATNIAKITYLMRYDDLESANSNFTKRKKQVLNSLSNEWTAHPRAALNMDAAGISDVEQGTFQSDLDNYLKNQR